ncbi:HAMP domain-containing histidine kinase [Pedobacter frigiditerrae]|uniref:histidine kinase n=1 Tax=Pedobacter frigiditerrae TaxID=2530452 RepID=A0A4R0N194_9SPHI|nr:HAMP domain-containing sensor histidine kinase [Pedobacter frigiditerrae]TCC93445.1 HAMP domain-containing histidine kinase [Pedobacter frigiditerrae]
MKKRSLWLITALMTLALLGVFVMQLYYIKESYKLNSKLFEQNVNQALNAVVNKVQKQNAVNHIKKKDLDFEVQRKESDLQRAQKYVDLKEKFSLQEEKRNQEKFKQILDALNYQDKLIKMNFGDAIVISEEEYVNLSKNSGIVFFLDETRDVNGNIKQRIAQLRYNPNRERTFNLTPASLPDTIRYLVQNPINAKPLSVSVATVDSTMAKKFKIEDAIAQRRYQQALKDLSADTINILDDKSVSVFQDAAKEMADKDVPLIQRIPSKEHLDTLIKRELLNKSITIDYDFWVKLANKDSIIYQNASQKTGEFLPTNVYRFTLFNQDIIRDPGLLYVYFPEKSSLIFSNMFVSMASSVALLLVLISIFAYTIYAIIRQKKLSEMKTDFINNMTHEFKTPVATIMIASEALKDPEVTEDKNRISRLANIIYDENVRLGNHIERVLSVARLEKKEIKLECNPVNVNDLITAVVDSMSLQLQKRNAVLTLDLNAAEDVIMGDELHLSNVIYNLIDNANKYSSDTPKIHISTKSNIKNLYIEISDEGIGLTKEQTKRIFDQFYRVPTGNLHDVKGFGLGLNYVQDIVNEMNGLVKVHSEKDKGTTFEVILPFKQSN